MQIASIFTKSYEDEDMVSFNINKHVLKAIQRVMENKTSTGASQAQCQLSPFLARALMLTRIVYQEIDMIDQLPPPLDEDDNIEFVHKLYCHKVKLDKADKCKRDSMDSAIGSQAKKLCGQLSGSNADEEREGTQGDSHEE